MAIRTALLPILAAGVAVLSACSVTKVGAATGSQDAIPSSSAAPSTTTRAPEPPDTWGDRFVWDDGLAVEIGLPQVCQPGEFAFPQNIARGLKIPVVVVNESSAAVDIFRMFIQQAQFDGRPAESIMDLDGPCGGPIMPTTVLPGKTFTTSMSVAVGPAPGELQVVVNPATGYDDQAVFVGPA